MPDADLVFWLMAGFLIAHELDAMRRHEWRVLPLVRSLPENVGREFFLWAHVPLFVLVLWIAAQGSSSMPALFLSAFAVIHVGLHWAFRNHPAYEFNNPSSIGLILGAGIFGAIHLSMVLVQGSG